MVRLGYGWSVRVRAGGRVCAIGLASLAGTAMAQPSAKPQPLCRACLEQPVAIPRLDNLYVGPHGLRPGPYQGEPGRACNVLASLTDANFAGGSFVVQAGFGQTEMAAATYSVPAAEWPIKINLTEVILATSNSTVTTTTHWSLLYYQGTPTSGTLVDTFSSDDVIIPHAVIPPGTNGVNVQFSIDPGDPEQLIIQDNGSHQFTVAFRIDQHNNQTQNPCLVGPPTASNAFPTTDVSGLGFASTNWLYGLNCGSFGCPANGGWSTFAALPGFCRPSGDWVMRTTWSSVLNCTPGVGACCLPSGNCQVLTVGDCGAQSGQYQGDGASCTGANCVSQTGACCLANGSCVAGQTSAQCAGQGGVFQGQGSVCGNCPQPTGACCLSNGNCLSFSSSDCTTAGGTWQGAGVACNGTLCPTGSCCLPSGQCLSAVTALDCTTQGGTFRGVGSTCAVACPQPTGACCLSNGNCLSLTASDCGLVGGTFAGAGTLCATACTQPCYPNCDASTGSPLLTANDFQCFLNKFASGATYANCDGSTGVPALTANDFQCFLNKYAAGCS